MQVSTGNVYPSMALAFQAGVEAHDLVEIRGTQAQIDSLSRAVTRTRADDRKKAARRTAQRSRRNNR